MINKLDSNMNDIQDKIEAAKKRLLPQKSHKFGVCVQYFLCLDGYEKKLPHQLF